MKDASSVRQADFGAEGQTIRRSTKPVSACPPPRRDLPHAPPAAVPEAEFVLSARLFLLGALGCIAVLVGLGLLAAYHGYNGPVPNLIVRAFLLDEETNIPTFFAFGLLVFCSVLLALVGARAALSRQAFRFHWLLLSALFLLLAFDEAASLHERLVKPVRAALDATGWLYFAWVVPASGFVAVLAVLYMPLLRGLPAPFGRLFLLSAALYLGGSLGVEMPGGAYAEAYGKQTFRYQILATIEETLEMLGLTVFGYALMRFLARQDGSVPIGFRAG